jgi:hypothetical protein
MDRDGPVILRGWDLDRHDNRLHETPCGLTLVRRRELVHSIGKGCRR